MTSHTLLSKNNQQQIINYVVMDYHHATALHVLKAA